MNAQQIKDEAQRLYKAIEDAQEALKNLRETCKHENTFEGSWGWAPGHYNMALICDDCGHCIKFLDLPNFEITTT